MRNGLPGIDELFELLAIEVPAGQVSQFAYGDNLSGYYEGYTDSSRKGEGYVLRGGPCFSDFAFSINDRRYSGDEALLTKIYPHCVETFFPGGIRTQFMLHSRRQVLSIRVHSEKKAKLSLIPFFPALVDPKISVAFSADTPFERERDSFHTGESRASFTLHLAFADSSEGAEKLASSLEDEDPFEARKKEIYAFLASGHLWTDDLRYNKALMWARCSSSSFVTEEEGRLGIWAGLPWFRQNWGRDTFISLPGILLSSGRFAEAKRIFRDFARFQKKDRTSEDYGKIPNRVAGDEVIYNTADGTPWFIREVAEYLSVTGELAFGKEIFPIVSMAVEGALSKRCDENGFFVHGDADTWMDARIEGGLPWSARGNRAIEIQALWYTALRAAVEIAAIAGEEQTAAPWSRAADRLKRSFGEAFFDRSSECFADRLRSDGSKDLKVRPNQLMVLSLPFGEDRLISSEQEALILKKSLERLMYPHGIASLSQEEDYFHPFHENWDFYHKDAAYHNGTVWGWNAGFAISALARFGCGDRAYDLAKNLAAQILEIGCLGTMSELVDAIPGPGGLIKTSGAWSQAWSVAEFVRNSLQDFVGFKPNLMKKEIRVQPMIPAAWNAFDASLAFGRGATFTLSFRRKGDLRELTLSFRGYPEPLLIFFGSQPERLLQEGEIVTFVDSGRRGCFEPSFLIPTMRSESMALAHRDALKEVILSGLFE